MERQSEETTGAPPLRANSLFAAHYEIVRCLRVGGMGAVYEVVDRRTARRRALKVMLGGIDPDMRERFQREATITANVRSENLVQIVDAGVDEELGTPYLAMELCDGPDLGEVLRERGALPSAEALELLSQLAKGLDRMHEASIVHRDLKPENLVVSKNDDGAPVLKILDFGVAKVVESTLQPATTRAVGTPAYMSPEQIDGDGAVGPEADRYAFAHLAYALLVGDAYWAREIAAGKGIFFLLVQIMRGSLERPSVRAARAGTKLPASFDDWFARATHKEPALRFRSSRDAINELAQCFASPDAPRRYRAHWLAGLALVVLGSAGVAARLALPSTREGAVGSGSPGPSELPRATAEPSAVFSLEQRAATTAPPPSGAAADATTTPTSRPSPSTPRTVVSALPTPSTTKPASSARPEAVPTLRPSSAPTAAPPDDPTDTR